VPVLPKTSGGGEGKNFFSKPETISVKSGEFGGADVKSTKEGVSQV